ncbi:uncharacterized protein F5891DRAFT_978983 [Suillus fuscotomentosus]|uniref:Uncharacterized protein n=1 Tax=Suillus fuscotomentosus TaxID=1912939 RepID=A0AAD4HMG2_9AGAM|nr:uncharacterized protein F5891DRAFT_978983 [Suillus fuscotomentosus]KAG1901842.1 hypothetical protein F5891DRAFT_978983 [Suillus fuscotomentosus]
MSLQWTCDHCQATTVLADHDNPRDVKRAHYKKCLDKPKSVHNWPVPVLNGKYLCPFRFRHCKKDKCPGWLDPEVAPTVTVKEIYGIDADLLTPVGLGKCCEENFPLSAVHSKTLKLPVPTEREIESNLKQHTPIQDSRHHKVQDEQETPQSKPETARSQNLDSIAAMSNIFLKALADTTGMSFTLLAGGPPSEAHGELEVYRFHAGLMKLGNYPNFEMGVVGPFRDFLHYVYSSLPAVDFLPDFTQNVTTEAEFPSAPSGTTEYSDPFWASPEFDAILVKMLNDSQGGLVIQERHSTLATTALPTSSLTTGSPTVAAAALSIPDGSSVIVSAVLDAAPNRSPRAPPSSLTVPSAVHPALLSNVPSTASAMTPVIEPVHAASPNMADPLNAEHECRRTSRKSKPSKRNDVANSIGILGKAYRGVLKS